MSRASREANRAAAAFLEGSGNDGRGILQGTEAWGSGLGEPAKPRHLLDLGNRPPPEPYVPHTAFRPHNKEARRRLGRMVKSELATLDEEEKLRSILERMVREMPVLDNRLPNPPILLVSESFSKSPLHMRVAKEMGLEARVYPKIPNGHVRLAHRIKEQTDE